MAGDPCEHCGRLVVNQSTDFGIGLVLTPTCQGVEVKVDRRVLGFISAGELRDFMARAYGMDDPVVAGR
jgi:hypothetical protein